MTALHYYLIDPTKNITALADTPISPESRPALAARIMNEEPSCEQVGFVDFSGKTPRLDMAGGEFCGNAAMSAAALYCANCGIPAGGTRRVTLDVSGADKPVEVAVAEQNGAFACTVAMPAPERISKETLFLGNRQLSLPVVYCPGIAHIMVTEDELTTAEAESALKGWCAALATQALGVMFLDRDALTLRPLVYVPAADTLCWESSCASGTCAAGAYLADRAERDVALTLSEPGGTLRVQTGPQSESLLSGRVAILKERTVNY
ncbi:MAG: hypothetical protein IJK89_00845 [Clostridia bacterium]|nr:hypothetical protein [Clostridia bacterium]